MDWRTSWFSRKLLFVTPFQKRRDLSKGRGGGSGSAGGGGGVVPSAGGTRKWDQNRSHRWNQVRKSVCYSEKQSKSRSSIFSIDDLKSVGVSNKDLLDIRRRGGSSMFSRRPIHENFVNFLTLLKTKTVQKAVLDLFGHYAVFFGAWYGLKLKKNFGTFRKVFGDQTCRNTSINGNDFFKDVQRNEDLRRFTEITQQLAKLRVHTNSDKKDLNPPPGGYFARLDWLFRQAVANSAKQSATSGMSGGSGSGSQGYSKVKGKMGQPGSGGKSY